MLDMFTTVAGYCWAIFVAFGKLALMPLSTFTSGGWFVASDNPFTSFVFTIRGQEHTVINQFISWIVNTIPFTSELNVIGLVLALVPLFFAVSLAVNALRTLLGHTTP